MKKFFVDNNSSQILVIIAGFALDEKPFRIMETKDSDYLYLYDYSDLTFEFDFSKYQKKSVLAFSYGVFILGLLSEEFSQFNKKICVNGTFKPIDKDFGINPKIFDLTLLNLSEESLLKFYSKMFDNSLDYEYFLENLPNRNIGNLKKELLNIKNLAKTYENKAFQPDKIYISKGDKIFPEKSQHNFWKNMLKFEIEAGHFLFYKFKGFSEILDL